MGANLAGKIPSFSLNLVSFILIKGVKMDAPAYFSHLPHVLLSFFAEPAQIIEIFDESPMIDAF